MSQYHVNLYSRGTQVEFHLHHRLCFEYLMNFPSFRERNIVQHLMSGQAINVASFPIRYTQNINDVTDIQCKATLCAFQCGATNAYAAWMYGSTHS